MRQVLVEGGAANNPVQRQATVAELPADLKTALKAESRQKAV